MQENNVPGISFSTELSPSKAGSNTTGVLVILWHDELTTPTDSTTPKPFDFSSWAAQLPELRNISLKGIVRGFFQNGGKRCYLAYYSSKKNIKNSLTSVLNNLYLIEDADLICIPPLMNGQRVTAEEYESFRDAQSEVLGFCERSGRHFALFDCLNPSDLNEAVNDAEKLLKKGTTASGPPAAIYFPWVSVADPSEIMLPPSALIAGAMARCDVIQHGTADAGNEPLEGVVNVGYEVSEVELKDISSSSVNCLKSFPGRGIRIWGVRALGTGSKHSFIREKRTLICLERWIDVHLSYAVFEPSNPGLWARLRRDVTAHLLGLQRAGALCGRSPEEAFYVKCDAITNPPESLDKGEVCMLIGLAISKPAEYFVVRVIHNAGGTSIHPEDALPR